jgi:hypothetical protein
MSLTKVSFSMIEGALINVLDYGAVGDWNGTTGTDNTAAIQAAIDKANTYTDGATVFFPPGNYKVTSTLTIFADRTGLLGNGAIITLTGHNTDGYPLFDVTHSATTVFPAFATVAIKGLRLVSAVNGKGFAFKVAGLGIDQFASQIHYQQLEITNFFAAWSYGNHAFTPMFTECAVASCVQVFRQEGTINTGAHFVFDKCLFTEIGRASPSEVAFNLGSNQSYKFIACDIEVSRYTCMLTNGSEVYLSNCHFELDVGLAGAPLFVVNGGDYGSFAFDQCTMFIWQTTSSTVPFWQSGGSGGPGRMSAFSFINSRIIQNSGVSGNATMYATYLLPFLGNGAMTFRSPMQSATGTNAILTAMSNNSLSNWNFANAYTEDWIEGGIGDPVSTTADVPYGTANCVVIPAYRFIKTDFIPVPDNAQMLMFACWAKNTVVGQAVAEFRYYNAKKELIGNAFSISITPSTLDTWELFVQGPTQNNILTKHAKYLVCALVSDETIENQVAYPFIDFA